MTKRNILAALLPAILAVGLIGCGDSDESGPGNLLTDPGLFDDPSLAGAAALVPAVPITPVPRYRPPSVALGPPSDGAARQGDYTYDPDDPPATMEFHVVRGPTASKRWTGRHTKTGAKKSTYMDPVVGTPSRHEHITDSEVGDNSLFKPYGSEHIVEGSNESLYE